MFYLKTGYHFSDHCEVAEITPMNTFATCCVCGREVHLRASDVIDSIRELMLGTYQCPECQEIYDKVVKSVAPFQSPYPEDYRSQPCSMMDTSKQSASCNHRRRRRADVYGSGYTTNNTPDPELTMTRFMEDE